MKVSTPTYQQKLCQTLEALLLLVFVIFVKNAEESGAPSPCTKTVRRTPAVR
jgi:hypothetical protein